jgi:hypothetical protein
VGWVTLRPTAVHSVRTKPAACGWLRLSSYNCADQSSIVIQSLPSESAVHQQRATRRCAVVDKEWAVWQSGRSLLETYPRVASGLPAALRLADVVDIAADVPVVETKIDGERLPCFGPASAARCWPRNSHPQTTTVGAASQPADRTGSKERPTPGLGGAQHRQRRHHDGAVEPVPGPGQQSTTFGWLAGSLTPNIFTRSQLNDPFAP